MGVDQEKDQSYVLHVLTQQHLAHVLFPVGDLAKPVVRQTVSYTHLTLPTSDLV